MASILNITLTIVVVVAAYLYYKHATSQDNRILAVLDGLKTIERENPIQGEPKVAAGFEATLDYIEDSLELLEALQLEPPKEMKPHNIVTSEKEFLETFAFFFNHSAASS